MSSELRAALSEIAPNSERGRGPSAWVGEWMSEYPGRRSFIFHCLMLSTMEVLSFWIPGTAALVLGIFVARTVFYKWVDDSEGTLTAWLLKTVVLMEVAAVLLWSLQAIQSWYPIWN